MILIILWLSSRRRLWSRINSKFFFQTLPIKPFAVPIRYLPKGFRRNEISSSITQKTALRYIIVTDLTLEEDTSKKEGGLLWNTSSRRFFIGGIFHGFLAGVDGLFDLSYIQHLHTKRRDPFYKIDIRRAVNEGDRDRVVTSGAYPQSDWFPDSHTSLWCDLGWISHSCWVGRMMFCDLLVVL